MTTYAHMTRSSRLESPHGFKPQSTSFDSPQYTSLLTYMASYCHSVELLISSCNTSHNTVQIICQYIFILVVVVPNSSSNPNSNCNIYIPVDKRKTLRRSLIKTIQPQTFLQEITHLLSLKMTSFHEPTMVTPTIQSINLYESTLVNKISESLSFHK